MKHTMKKLVSLVLVLAMFIGIVPTQAYATEIAEVPLPEMEIGDDILDADVFYLASATASIAENSRMVYLLRVARGGPADSESTVLVKIADMTAKYGQDYIVRVKDEKTKVENPEDNYSLLEMIAGSDFEQQTINDQEEFAAMLEQDEEAQAAYQEGMEAALEYLEEASGLKEKYGDEDPYAEGAEEFAAQMAEAAQAEADGELAEAAEPAQGEAAAETATPTDADEAAPAEGESEAPAAESEESAAGESEEAAGEESAAGNEDVDDERLYEGALPAIENGETITINNGKADEGLSYNPVQQATNLFSGKNATAQRLTADGDMMQDLQAIANVMTNAVVGASVELTFAEGETEKYLEIVPKDNRKGEGDKMFYIILGAPGGKTTNSAASACAITIVDDEEVEPATVNFSQAVYTHTPGEDHVTVRVERSGPIGTVISAKVVTTGEGTAEMSRDYSEVDSELIFPFGIDHLTLDIPVRTEYLSGAGDFGLALEAVASCEVGDTGTATVQLQGTYTNKENLLAEEYGKLMDADGELMAGDNMTFNALNTIKTLDKLNLSKPFYKNEFPMHNSANDNGSYGFKFGGQNQWSGDAWKMNWYAPNYYVVFDQGVTGVTYKLTDDYYDSFFLGGAAVHWNRTYKGHEHAWIKVAILGSKGESAWYMPYYSNYMRNDDIYTANNKTGQNVYWYPYDSTRYFDDEIQYIYPHENAIKTEKQGLDAAYTWDGKQYQTSYVTNINGDHPQYISIMNMGCCQKCAELDIYDISPILRPFWVSVQESEPLKYLTATGTRSAVKDSSTQAALVEGGAGAVFFKDDTFSVQTVAASNVRQYAYITGLKLLDGKDKSQSLLTLLTNDDPSKNTVSYTLDHDNMKKLVDTICPLVGDRKYGDYSKWVDLLRDNGDTMRNTGLHIDGYPTFVDFTVQPTLGYIDATVTLRNPYTFPVTFTISGKDYTVEGHKSVQIQTPDGQGFHKGDTLAISAVTPTGSGAGMYAAAGVRYWGKYKTTSPGVDKEGTWDFLNQQTIYVGEEDQRLTFADVIIEPNLQAKTNTIRVRVKTDELSHFDTKIEYGEDGKTITHHPGVLATRGTVSGEYTYFTFANKNGTFNGRTYAVTATPLDENEVCVWFDPVTQKTYEGNTFYFTAGGEPERNLITLSAAPASCAVSLQGTLRYANYNLLTGYEGNESMTPAMGAVLATGSGGGTANDDGFVKASAVKTTGAAGHYLRYMVSVNGTDITKEILLPEVTASVLWDFNGSDMAMDKKVRTTSGNIQWTAYDGGDADAYTFTTGPDGKAGLIAINTDNTDFSQMRYMKLRIKNLNGKASNCRLYASINGGNLGAAYVVVPIKSNSEWTEYVVDLTTCQGYKADAWNGKVTYIRLDLGWVPETYAIDYVGFFPTEAEAKAFRSSGAAEIVAKTIDISSNFPKGVSPVTSGIFKNITIDAEVVNAETGKATDNWSVQNGSQIPVVKNYQANLTTKIDLSYYSYIMTGEDGRLYVKDKQLEKPRAVQYVVYDNQGNFKFALDEVTDIRLEEDEDDGISYVANSSIFFGKAEEEEATATDLEEEPVQLPEPGDRLYLRLTTNRLAQTKAIAPVGEDFDDSYQYADVYTGMDFYQPMVYKVVKIGIESPIKIDYPDLPLIGNSGMNLNLPFVQVGVIKIHQGFRIYIGVSPMQITDAVKKSHITSMSGPGGVYWKELFSIGDPFGSFANGIKTAWNGINEFRDQKESGHAASGNLGGKSWKFDLSVGMYFDFHYLTLTQEGKEHTICNFDGLGGYLSVTLGFQCAWYTILPVVFIPFYFAVELEGMFLGFLGADLNTTDDWITYDDTVNGNANLNSGVKSLRGSIRMSGTAQISVGVGLCGVLGARIAVNFNAIGNWEPVDDPDEYDWGALLNLKAGMLIDLFLFSVPLMYTFGPWPFGSFKQHVTNTFEAPDDVSEKKANKLMAADEDESIFVLRESTGSSEWVGSDDGELMGAFAPNKVKQKELVSNAYDRPDSQLITLSDGKTVVLAYIDSDEGKDETQRTTLKMATYHPDTGWSEPVIVSDDETADFQPSIAETKDGKVLVAWVSPVATNTDLSTNGGVIEYLNSTEVFAAFISLDENKNIKTLADDNTVADTVVTRLSNDHFTDAEQGLDNAGFYDANPTVAYDMESGDAMVYYVKSGRAYLKDGDITEYINPYTNDCAVCYMMYNAAADDDEGVPAGWLFNNFYLSELGGVREDEQFMIDNFGGQRMLDGEVNAKGEYYAIPDFTAVAYNGMTVYAYTVDTDGSNDTDADKELRLQVYDFRNHQTKFRINLTDDNVADAMPQLFRTRVNGSQSTSDADTHTKLFWFRNGKQVVYIDVTELLREGIDSNGKLKTKGDGTEYTYYEKDGDGFVAKTKADDREYTYVGDDGKTHNRFTEPHPVWYVNDSNGQASLSQADFRAVEDAEGNLYLLWSETVTREDGNAAREIFASGLVGYETDAKDENGNATTVTASSGWSQPYRITRDGYINDEFAVAMSGENLVVVHDQYKQELVEVPEGEQHTADVVASTMPLIISDMSLMADVLEPCGSVETENITIYHDVTVVDEDGTARTVPNQTTMPRSNEKVSVVAEVANNGMNTAKGYKLSLYANDALVSTIEVTDALTPNSRMTHSFDYTMPGSVDGLTFKVVAQEMRDADTKDYYSETDTFTAEPLVAEAVYEIAGVETYQAADGFHAKFSVTNVGNARSSSGDTVSIDLQGPANLARKFTDEQLDLYSANISLRPDETKEFDVPVNILPEMMRDYLFITASVTVEKEVAAQTLGGTTYTNTRILSNQEYADFDLTSPMNMELDDVSVDVGDSAEVSLTMDLGDVFGDGKSTVTYAVDDLTVAQIADGKVVGISAGKTVLYATHAATGATVSSAVTVNAVKTGSSSSDGHFLGEETGEETGADNTNTNTTPATTTPAAPAETTQPAEQGNNARQVTIAGGKSVNVSYSGSTAALAAMSAEELNELADAIKDSGSATMDLTGLGEDVTAVSIPAETLAAIAGAMTDGAEGLTINLPGSTVTLDAKALAALAEQANGSDLTLHADPIAADKLSAKQKEALSELEIDGVYDVYVTSGDTRITDLGGGKVTVKVPYRAKIYQLPEDYTVWFIAEDGTMEQITANATADFVEFDATRVGCYAVTSEKIPDADDGQTDEGTTETAPQTKSSTVPVVVGIGGVCVIGVLIWLLAAKRRRRDEDEK